MRLAAILVITWCGLNIVDCESPPELPFPVSPCGEIGGQCRIFSSPCTDGEVEGPGSCNRMSKCCLTEDLMNHPKCKETTGGRCMKKGKWLNCKGIIDKDYVCPRRRICCLEGVTNNCRWADGEAPCPMDCAIEKYKDSNGCEVCRCKPGGSANPWQ